jgi:hypothetical protein
MQIRQRIIRSAHRYAHPDRANHIGYGIPDAWAAYTMSTEAVSEVRPASAVSSQKIMLNGQLYILRDGKLYDVLGHRIE